LNRGGNAKLPVAVWLLKLAPGWSPSSDTNFPVAHSLRGMNDGRLEL
jgi:hypothetical protein